MTSDIAALREARERFFSGGEVPAGLVAEPILKSWQRCADQGLDAGDLLKVQSLSSTELRERQQVNDLLRHLCRPEIGALRADAKLTDSVVILTDASGMVLDTLGSVEFAGAASEVALRPGVTWNEASTGTNAIGTALVERRPIVVHGAEHFLEPHRMLTCAAAPILDPYGRLVGVLDMSGNAAVQHVHALGLVRLAVEQVEHRFFGRGFEDGEVVRFQREADLLGTPREAILVFKDGLLIAGNRRGMKFLGLDRRMFGMAKRDELFERVGASRLRSPAGEEFAVTAKPAPPKLVRGADLREVPKPYFVTETQSALRKAVKLADAEIPLLIQGETGVGKEVFAREMHRHTNRSDKPFVAINCAALPEGLIESELFGYADGAFTGARKQGREGLIQQANGGILFLDEIGDMPLGLQSRILRVLQDREVTPLGGGKATKVDFLPVCATHRPLKQLVDGGQFRADLYFRLAHFVIELPPLRELQGMADVVRALWRQLGAESAGVTMSAATEGRLLAYTWPGNFRQLAGMLRAVLALAERGQVVEVADLPVELVAAGASPGGTLDAITDDALRGALEQAGGNVSRAARTLGVDRSTLYRRVLWKGATGLRH